jgi:hypothetical protein
MKSKINQIQTALKRMSKRPPALLACILLISSCAKGPGEGGKASIYGTLIVKNYDANFTSVQATYPAQSENVYIIYGDDRTYSKSVKTNYDGTYEFPYLRPGKYTVYSYSKDTTKYLNGVPSQAGSVIASKTIEVVSEVEISGKKDEVKVDDMYIIK